MACTLKAPLHVALNLDTCVCSGEDIVVSPSYRFRFLTWHSSERPLPILFSCFILKEVGGSEFAAYVNAIHVWDWMFGRDNFLSPCRLVAFILHFALPAGPIFALLGSVFLTPSPAGIFTLLFMFVFNFFSVRPKTYKIQSLPTCFPGECFRTKPYSSFSPLTHQLLFLRGHFLRSAIPSTNCLLCLCSFPFPIFMDMRFCSGGYESLTHTRPLLFFSHSDWKSIAHPRDFYFTASFFSSFLHFLISSRFSFFLLRELC